MDGPNKGVAASDISILLSKKRARLGVIDHLSRSGGESRRLGTLRMLAEIDLSLSAPDESAEPLDEQIDLVIAGVGVHAQDTPVRPDEDQAGRVVDEVHR